MSSFTAPLLLEDIPGTKFWRVGRDLAYHVGTYPSSHIVLVPAGFKTDLASIPRILWTLVGHPAGPYRAAAVIHDWLYQTQVASRKQADDIFLEGMHILKVGVVQRHALYSGVRAGGWVTWNKYARRLAA